MPLKVFITGGTSGIGLALADLYYNEGHDVAVCGRNIDKIPVIYRDKFKCYQVDVSKNNEIKSAIDSFVDNCSLDLLIANAGISVGKKSSTPNFLDDFKVTEVNVLGFLNTVHAGLFHMTKAKSGHIISIASVAGFIGLPGAGAYCASKSFIIKYCESLSLDLSDQNIIVSTVCPGFIDTPLTQKNDHSMPFLMNVHKGALKIKKSIDKRKTLYIFPWQMKLVITFLNKMPRVIYRWIMKSPLINYSK